MGFPTHPFGLYRLGKKHTAEWFTALGYLLWILTYVLVIWQSYNDHRYGVPLVAICANITWEFYFGVLCGFGLTPAWCFSDMTKLETAVILVWLVLDAVILWQLFAYGAADQSLPQVKHYFVAFILLTLFLAFCAQVTFIICEDQYGIESAWIANLLMSILFVLTAFQRTDRAGLSYPAAWTKMLGSAFIALGLWNGSSLASSTIPGLKKEDLRQLNANALRKFLFFTVFGFDCWYIYLLSS